MEYLLIPWHHNHKGGINNLNVMQIRNERQELIKSFTSLISMDRARKRASAYIRKLKNPQAVTAIFEAEKYELFHGEKKIQTGMADFNSYEEADRWATNKGYKITTIEGLED